MRAKTKKSLQVVLWIGLLCLETAWIITFYVIPQLQVRNAPRGHWQAETPHSVWLLLAGVGLLGVFIGGNIGLIVVIRRQIKELKQAA